MSQKHGKLNQNRKFRRDNLSEEHEHQTLRRPILFGSDDVARMAVERSRANFMRKLASKPVEHSGEFGSYFYGLNRQTDPAYSITSHTIKGRERSHGSVIHTYPSLVQNLRWNPTVETSSVYQCQTNDRRTTEAPPNITCRCRDCGSKHCRGQSIPSDFKPRVFKDNIKRFTDNSTMTPKLNDACCGSFTPVNASAKTSDVSVSGSDVAVRDNYCAMALSQVYLNCDPVSILKKTTRCEPIKDYEQDEYDNYTQKEKKCQIEDNYQEAVRDIEENDYHEVSESRPMRTFPKIFRNKFCDHHVDEIPPRKNIYNEGISDLMVNCLPPIPPPFCPPSFPPYPERFQDTPSLKSDYSRTSMSRKLTVKKEEMPFAHNTESKYHEDCKKPQAEVCYPTDHSVERFTISPKKFKKTYSSKPVPYSNTQSIKFPRKVLSSERDIESYIGHQSTKGFMR